MSEPRSTGATYFNGIGVRPYPGRGRLEFFSAGLIRMGKTMLKQVIVMRTDLGMNAGKMCSQAAHVAMLFTQEIIKGRPMTGEERDWMFGNAGQMAKEPAC